MNSVPEITEVPPRINRFGNMIHVFFSRKIVTFSFIIICIFLITAIFAPLIAPYDPYMQNLDEALQKPSAKHILGTDAIGRDTLSRIIFGSRTSLLIGAVAIGIAASIGMLLGLIAGYFGKMTYAIIMRIIDAMMCFPLILLALLIAALLGGGLKNVVIALGIGLIPSYCRLMSGQVLSVKEADYVLAAHASGSGHLRIMFLHIVPNCFPPLLVLLTMNIGMAILAEAGLSFLGVGIEAPGSAWGSMVSDGYKYLILNPVLSLAPGFCIIAIVFAFNMLGDGLRDALDPRLEGTF